MTTQAVSSNIANFIDIGNAIVYAAPTALTSFSSAVSSTKWRKLGILKNGCQIDRTLEQLAFKSGSPLRDVKILYTQEELKLSGELLEIYPENLARATGLTLTYTTKASSPAPTTVATGSTKTVINVASATGYAVDDHIKVGNSGSEQYGVIASIAGNALTLYEGLSNDANPTTGHAVAKIDKAYVAFGSLSAPTDIALKISKTLTGGYGTLDFYVLKANSEGNFTMAWADNNGTVEGVGVPFSFKAIADTAVENGELARAYFTQT